MSSASTYCSHRSQRSTTVRCWWQSSKPQQSEAKNSVLTMHAAWRTEHTISCCQRQKINLFRSLTWSRSSAHRMPSALRCNSDVGSQMCAGTLRCVMSFPTKSLMIDQMLKLGVDSADAGRLLRLWGMTPSDVASHPEFQEVLYTRASGDLR